MVSVLAFAVGLVAGHLIMKHRMAMVKKYRMDLLKRNYKAHQKLPSEIRMIFSFVPLTDEYWIK